MLTPAWLGHHSGVLVRPYLPFGLYPAEPFYNHDAAFIFRPDLAVIYSVVRCARRELPSEQPWITPEELRLLSALSLSVPSDLGKISPYPSCRVYQLIEEPDITNTKAVHGIGDALLAALASDTERQWLGRTEPVLPADRDAYETTPEADLPGRAMTVYNAVDCEDALLLRGLGALVKAPLLAQHYLFHTEACMTLHVAMEASGELIRRALRARGMPDSYGDAGDYLCRLFGETPSGKRFFEDFYDDRIKASHPSSRLGTYSDAPLAADDYHDLHENLLDVYYALLTRVVSEPTTKAPKGTDTAQQPHAADRAGRGG